ncbi:NACHT N-terminal Helical domain 1-containing protein [Nonomuraea endophytica]|uniref:NACHT N-terminal Helical domain-containing protein n=1 Tax=Nonomuraea endophytica TaxID=714136 RepID=A0A7W8A2C0_9ACTN|nr:hypothetical protein [Nonomuraea endophytica]MBB5078225.1 hypothetical protein [Nonomuraea endophytica]
MPGVETAVVAAGKAIAERAMREWLAARAASRDRDAQLKDMIQSGFRDRLAPRKFGNQLEGMAMAVEARLRDLVEQEYRGLDEDARSAVLLEVVESLRTADLSDEALFNADADPARLARRVLDTVAPPRLGTTEDALYGVLLAECVACLVGMMQQLPPYLPRAATESLARLSGLAEGMERVLARLPVRTLDAPEGSQDDHAFEQHYLAFLSRTLDEVELFGVPMETYRPRTSLSVAYISLTVSAGHERRPPERLAPASLTGRDESEPGSRRIESAPATQTAACPPPPTCSTTSPRRSRAGCRAAGPSACSHPAAACCACRTGRLTCWSTCPVPGRIDFAHKTVQEYLAAGQLVEDDDGEAAVERAHLDQWREVVVMTAGHATGRLRRDLLRGLLDRADDGGRHTRRLRLLVASCLETIREIPLELRERVESCLAEVIPPRTEDEARILAAAGEEILRRVPDDLSAFTPLQAALTVRMTGLIPRVPEGHATTREPRPPAVRGRSRPRRPPSPPEAPVALRRPASPAGHDAPLRPGEPT